MGEGRRAIIDAAVVAGDVATSAVAGPVGGIGYTLTVGALRALRAKVSRSREAEDLIVRLEQRSGVAGLRVDGVAEVMADDRLDRLIDRPDAETAALVVFPLLPVGMGVEERARVAAAFVEHLRERTDPIRNQIRDLADALVERGSAGHDSGIVSDPRVQVVLGRLPADEQLTERSGELAYLHHVVAHEGLGRYEAIVAPPFAGKSTLLAHIAAHPPPDTDVVAFFISRAAGRDTVSAALDVLNGQLLHLLGEQGVEPGDVQRRRYHFDRLWESAVGATAAAGRNLVLVVDGLDEQADAISSLLPARLAPHVTGLVGCRPNPATYQLAEGVHHPLAAVFVDPMRIEPTINAAQLRREAQVELDSALGRTAGAAPPHPLAGAVLATMAATRGADVRTIASVLAHAGYDDRPPARVEDEVDVFVRRSSLVTRTQVGGSHWALAHEVFLSTMEREHGDRVERSRAGLRDWAREWADAGWPEATPSYLLERYPRALRPAGLAELLDHSFRLRVRETIGNEIDLSATMRRATVHAAPDDLEVVDQVWITWHRLDDAMRWEALSDTDLARLAAEGRGAEAIEIALAPPTPRTVWTFLDILRADGGRNLDRALDLVAAALPPEDVAYCQLEAAAIDPSRLSLVDGVLDRLASLPPEAGPKLLTKAAHTPGIASDHLDRIVDGATSLDEVDPGLCAAVAAAPGATAAHLTHLTRLLATVEPGPSWWWSNALRSIASSPAATSEHLDELIRVASAHRVVMTGDWLANVATSPAATTAHLDRLLDLYTPDEPASWPTLTVLGAVLSNTLVTAAHVDRAAGLLASMTTGRLGALTAIAASPAASRAHIELVLGALPDALTAEIASLTAAGRASSFLPSAPEKIAGLLVAFAARRFLDAVSAGERSTPDHVRRAADVVNQLVPDYEQASRTTSHPATTRPIAPKAPTTPSRALRLPAPGSRARLSVVVADADDEPHLLDDALRIVTEIEPTGPGRRSWEIDAVQASILAAVASSRHATADHLEHIADQVQPGDISSRWDTVYPAVARSHAAPPALLGRIVEVTPAAQAYDEILQAALSNPSCTDGVRARLRGRLTEMSLTSAIRMLALLGRHDEADEERLAQAIAEADGDVERADRMLEAATGDPTRTELVSRAADLLCRHAGSHQPYLIRQLSRLASEPAHVAALTVLVPPGHEDRGDVLGLLIASHAADDELVGSVVAEAASMDRSSASPVWGALAASPIATSSHLVAALDQASGESHPHLLVRRVLINAAGRDDADSVLLAALHRLERTDAGLVVALARRPDVRAALRRFYDI